MTNNILCLTQPALDALAEATRRASTRRPWVTGTLHVLIGLANQTESVAKSVLAQHEISAANMWTAIDYWYTPSPRFIGQFLTPKWTKAARAVVLRAVEECNDRGGRNIDTGDLLCAVLGDTGSRSIKLLARAGLDAETLRLEIKIRREVAQEGPGIRPVPDMTKARPVAARAS